MRTFSFSSFGHVTLTSVLLFSVVACSSLVRNPVPLDRIEQGELAGMPGVRTFWSKNNVDPVFQQDLIDSIRSEPAELFEHDVNGFPSYDGLALSGGGSSGAFGAGILYGWSETGTRPQFKLVTGVSAGALIAPYAFLGKPYDEKLKRVWTTVSTKDIARINKRAPFRSDALTDTSPLAVLIARDLNESMLADIATAHANGQRLYIGTSNLDAQRFVVWNMGAIAASGHPNSLQLFRDVMLASASIPGAFPPVYINVEVEGQAYDEMHVDGGVFTQVFFYEFLLNIKNAANTARVGTKNPNSSHVYVIRNGKATSEPIQVPREVISIASRAVSTMIKSASLNDLWRIYQRSKEDQIDFNYTDIPGGFEYESSEVFDQGEMKALFELGYRMSLEGHAWQKAPFEARQVE